MKLLKLYLLIFSFLFLQDCSTQVEVKESEMTAQEVQELTDKVVNWQLENYTQEKWGRNWKEATLFIGLVTAAKTFKNDFYWEITEEWAKNNSWKLGGRKMHADDHAVAQVYIELYKRKKDDNKLKNTINIFNNILKLRPKGRELWSWSDALFMAPPVLAELSVLTEDKKYKSFLNREFWDAINHLYNYEYQLLYRDKRFFDKFDSQGNPVFWSRGNGWVIGGLIRILSTLKEDDPAYYEYLHLFKSLMETIVNIQPSDGLWRSNLLSPGEFSSPETSGTAFFCYGLAWGLNQNIFTNEKYKTAFKKAWQGLKKHINEDGKLVSAQAPDDRPRSVEKNNSELYATGALLMVLTEVYKLKNKSGSSF